MFTEHFVFLISDYIKEDHIRCCLIAEREEQNPLGTKLVVKVKDKRSVIWGKLGAAKRVVSVCRNFLKAKLQ